MKRTSTLALAGLLIVSHFIGSSVEAQNLVPNPGFEVQDTCPAVSQITLAPPWNSPTLGTPDLFNSTCGMQNGPARTGIGSSGVFTFSSFPDNREYIQAPLTAPLVAGQLYCVSFWVLRTNFQYAVDKIGAHFRAGALSQTTTGVLNFVPQVESPTGITITGTSWTLISGTFTAAGGEDHILIGNFQNDANTNQVVVNAGSSSDAAFYRIDDVQVTACFTGIEEALNPDLITVFPQPAQDVVNIRFPGDMTPTGLQLLAADGRVVKALSSLDVQREVAELGLSDVPPGLYVLSVQFGNKAITKRILVNR